MTRLSTPPLPGGEVGTLGQEVRQICAALDHLHRLPPLARTLHRTLGFSTRKVNQSTSLHRTLDTRTEPPPRGPRLAPRTTRSPAQADPANCAQWRTMASSELQQQRVPSRGHHGLARSSRQRSSSQVRSPADTRTSKIRISADAAIVLELPPWSNGRFHVSVFPCTQSRHIWAGMRSGRDPGGGQRQG